MARPTIPKEKQMETRAFRAPPAYWAGFDQKVEKSGLSQADYFRRALLNDETIIQAVEKKTPIEKEVIFVVRKASNNLNQIAHALNAAHLEGRMSTELYQQAEASLDMILRHLKAIL